MASMISSKRNVPVFMPTRWAGRACHRCDRPRDWRDCRRHGPRCRPGRHDHDAADAAWTPRPSKRTPRNSRSAAAGSRCPVAGSAGPSRRHKTRHIALRRNHRSHARAAADSTVDKKDDSRLSASRSSPPTSRLSAAFSFAHRHGRSVVRDFSVVDRRPRRVCVEPVMTGEPLIARSFLSGCPCDADTNHHNDHESDEPLQVKQPNVKRHEWEADPNENDGGHDAGEDR
jgi:hypothetical protein